jgi:hypothetical protein
MAADPKPVDVKAALLVTMLAFLRSSRGACWSPRPWWLPASHWRISADGADQSGGVSRSDPRRAPLGAERSPIRPVHFSLARSGSGL